MPPPHPHPLALFSLVPLNERALAVFNHPDNSHLASAFGDGNGNYNHGIDVGFNICSTSGYTLATMGRGEADIRMEGAYISSVQCSFEIHQTLGTIMLFDQPNSQSTQVFGQGAVPFESGRIRRIFLPNGNHIVLGMGGLDSNLVQFSLFWHSRTFDVGEQARNRVDCPRLTRTMDLGALTEQHDSRSNTFKEGEAGLQTRYLKVDNIATGSFGEVCKVWDLESRKILAVKKIKKPEDGSEARRWKSKSDREVEISKATSHPRIVEFISFQRTDDQVEIFMALKEGGVENMIGQNLHMAPEIVYCLFEQVLQALDYLAYRGMVHRDVKPANILYTSEPGGRYSFQLAEFGKSNFVIDAKTYVGTHRYMAPEVLQNQGVQQSSKVDVCSLFVTLAQVLNMNGYRTKTFRTKQEIIDAVQEVATISPLDSFKEMAIINPDQRASAAQMLAKHCEGRGPTTPHQAIN